MRKKSGFTLIELMVVLAIIAILATAGISAYGGYIKKARDAKRLQDVSALETIAISSFTTNGMAVDYTTFMGALETANNNTVLKDPLDTKNVCLGAFIEDGNTEPCEYLYAVCENGGFLIQTRFESTANHYYYTQDKLNGDSGSISDSHYDIGNCDVVSSGPTAIR